jgi:hypothetical protein
VVIADAASVAMIGVGFADVWKYDGFIVAGGFGYMLAAPVVHVIHGRLAIGAIDAGLRLALPLVLGEVAFQIARQPCTGDCSSQFFPSGTGEGFAAGIAGAGLVSILDAAVFSWERPAPDAIPAAAPRTALQWAPTAVPVRGGALAGVVGRF